MNVIDIHPHVISANQISRWFEERPVATAPVPAS